MEGGDEPDYGAALDFLQSMIDISAERLDGLRTQCSTTAELTQREIQILEVKLIKLFSQEIVVKSKLQSNTNVSTKIQLQDVPSLVQWLKVVGLCSLSVQNICAKIKTFEALQEYSLKDLLKFLCSCPYHDEELLRFTKATQSLKMYTGLLMENNVVDTNSANMKLHWDSWDWKNSHHIIPDHDDSSLNCKDAADLITLDDVSKCVVNISNLNVKKKDNEICGNGLKKEFKNASSSLSTNYINTAHTGSSFNQSNLHDYYSPDNKSLTIPRSPSASTAINRGMTHDISHRFTKHFSFNTPCDYCCKPIIMNTGLKCKECRYRCHKDCESKVPPSCGLPVEYVNEFKRSITSDSGFHSSNGSLPKERPINLAKITCPGSMTNIDQRVKEFSKSSPNEINRSSAGSSSAPSSPSAFAGTTTEPARKFVFDVQQIPVKPEPPPPVQEPVVSVESSKVEDENTKLVDRDDSQDSQSWDSASDKAWPRQYSVGTFRKTRHDNLVLFMGACMKPPRLAIVTSMVHGNTLYKCVHLRKERFSMTKTAQIAQQISQAMGYLHAKGIIHKDLRSKNIFLENERVVITDFGLFNVTKLCLRNKAKDGLLIPPGWLCYLAPEIMRGLKVDLQAEDEYTLFTKESDIYAFGTVWYELLSGNWPFENYEPAAIIWQVGKGMKPSLANLEATRDVKDILMQCWSYDADKRPDFGSLLKTLNKLPKKRLARSPSHPIHLSRSAESMF